MNKSDLPPRTAYTEWRAVLRSLGANDVERAEVLGVTEPMLRAWLRKPPLSVIYFCLVPTRIRSRLVKAIHNART